MIQPLLPGKNNRFKRRLLTFAIDILRVYLQSDHGSGMSYSGRRIYYRKAVLPHKCIVCGQWSRVLWVEGLFGSNMLRFTDKPGRMVCVRCAETMEDAAKFMPWPKV